MKGKTNAAAVRKMDAKVVAQVAIKTRKLKVVVQATINIQSTKTS